MRLNIEPRAMDPAGPRKLLPPTPPMRPSRTSSPSLGSLTSQERGHSPRTTVPSEYRKHSLENILQPAEDFTNKRIKSSDSRPSIPDDIVRPPNTGETPPSVWKELHDHFKHVHEQEYSQTELARAESEAAGDGREVGGESERLGRVSAEKGKERQFETRERVILDSPLKDRSIRPLQLGEKSEHDPVELARALVGMRGADTNSTDSVIHSTTSKQPSGGPMNENAVPPVRGPTSEGHEEVARARPPWDPAVPSAHPAVGLTSLGGQPMIYFQVDGRIQPHMPLTTILDNLNSTIPHWVAGLPTSSSNMQALTAQLSAEEEFVRKQDETIAEKRSNIRSLGQKYEELIQMMPESQREELILMRDKTRTAMEEEIDSLSKARNQFANSLKDLNSTIARFNSDIVELKRVIPDLVRNLTDLESRLP